MMGAEPWLFVVVAVAAVAAMIMTVVQSRRMRRELRMLREREERERAESVRLMTSQLGEVVDRFHARLGSFAVQSLSRHHRVPHRRPPDSNGSARDAS